MTFAFIQRLVDRIVTVSEDDLSAAIAGLVATEHLVAEGAGAAAAAALVGKRARCPRPPRCGDRVGRQYRSGAARIAAEQKKLRLNPPSDYGRVRSTADFGSVPASTTIDRSSRVAAVVVRAAARS
ncbi:MAG: hypothetical protein DMF95_27060 [Acidobacteria bacterium]|nr:MAG: hypothetical protein DMF95_27060 [Acidobacteriota bacterium]